MNVKELFFKNIQTKVILKFFDRIKGHLDILSVI